MHIVLGLIALVGTAYFWVWRARNAAEMTHELLDVANDVRLAARRFGFKRRNNSHPVEAIDDPLVAAGAVVVAFLELDDYPTAEQKTAMISALRDTLHVTHDDAEELATLGRWLVKECGAPAQAVPRLGRKLYKLSGQDHFNAIASSLRTIAKFGTGALSDAQKDALADLAKAMKMA